MKRQDVIQSMNLFALKLYSSLNDHPDKNLFFGPSSVYAALSMLYAGASDATATELQKLLCLPTASLNFHDIFAKIWRGIIQANNGKNECSLNVANCIWVKKNMNIKENYIKTLKENYLSDAVYMDFADQVEEVRQKINHWVSEKTKQKINEMIQPDGLASNSIMLITNAMYFYGQWVHDFDVIDTKPMSFYTSNGIIDVEMMCQSKKFEYHESSKYDCKSLLLPYQRSALKFMIMLPNKMDGLSILEKRIASGISKGNHFWDLSSFELKNVDIFLPKFSICEQIDLLTSLQGMGFPHIFREGDFRNISEVDGVDVSSISHAANVTVNEKGTEVAVCTVLGLLGASLYDEPVQFKVDHPFLFMIIDKDTEIILFLGKVCTI